VLHGLGGSAAVTIMLLTLISEPLVAAVGLTIFAVCAALSIAALSTGLGAVLHGRMVRRQFGVLAPGAGDREPWLRRVVLDRRVGVRAVTGGGI
jgi:hypothetical protein